MLPVRLLRGAGLRRLPVPGISSSVHSAATPDSTPAALEHMPQNMENPFKDPPKRCILCGVLVDYKNTQLLSQFVSPHTGRIYGRHMTGLCGLKQKAVAKAIKRAIIMGFMPATYKNPEYLKDPKICDI